MRKILVLIEMGAMSNGALVDLVFCGEGMSRGVIASQTRFGLGPVRDVPNPL